ncbi:MAG: hypothetical protein EP338_05465 [Bacteroidetes bacterium]|nr:MAG: hypothetical protein EP338_05465 [Bacteroidota bacterium]
MMKRFQYFFFYLICFLLFTSCNREFNDFKLEGKWKVVKSSFQESSMSDAQRQNRSDFQANYAQNKQLFKDAPHNMTFDFRQDSLVDWKKSDGDFRLQYRLDRSSSKTNQGTLHIGFSLFHVEILDENEIKLIDDNVPLGYRSELILQREKS